MGMTGDIFDGAAFPDGWGVHAISLTKARRAVAGLSDMLWGWEESGDRYVPMLLAAADDFDGWGAHSVARAIRYSVAPGADLRHPADLLVALPESAAERWLLRLETDALGRHR